MARGYRNIADPWLITLQQFIESGSFSETIQVLLLLPPGDKCIAFTTGSCCDQRPVTSSVMKKKDKIIHKIGLRRESKVTFNSYKAAYRFCLPLFFV